MRVECGAAAKYPQILGFRGFRDAEEPERPAAQPRS
jgi:hypothetical protein